MNRRSFIGVLGAAPALAAAPDKRTRFYLMQSVKLKAGTQPSRVHDFNKAMLPKVNASWNGPKIYLEALVAPHMPQMITIYGFISLDELSNVHTKLISDPEHGKALAALESGPEPAMETIDSTLLEAAPYSPDVAPSTPDSKPRIFELRTYHSPTYHQLIALHERFAGQETKLFDRHGIHPILYSSTLIGPNIPNLTYVIPFDTLAQRESAWNAFGADPEWIKVRKESIDKNGQVSSIQNISLWKATDYSPVR